MKFALASVLFGMAVAVIFWPQPKSECEQLYDQLRTNPDAVALDQLLISCEQAHNQNPNDAHLLYLSGKTMTLVKADEQAVDYFYQAAEVNHPAAQHELALAYLTARGREYDPKVARQWLQQAAESDYAPAQRQLALLHQIGEGDEINLQQAFYWYQQAAEQDDVDAQIELALAYQRGMGVTANREQAHTWLQRAAEAEHPNAQYMLAMEYFNGGLVQQNYIVAQEWLQRAATNGYGEAEKGFFANGLCRDIGARN